MEQLEESRPKKQTKPQAKGKSESLGGGGGGGADSNFIKGKTGA